MTDIFVSYSRKDSAVARKLFEAFKTVDLKPWVDWEEIPPAVDWLDQILQGIEKSDAFIFLVSPDSAISEVCKVEIAHATKNNKRIIPILVRDVDTKTVIETIRDLNWILLREIDDFQVGVERVKLAINLDIEWVSSHRRLQVLALEWDRRKDVSLLLRGGDLRNARMMILSAQQKEPTLTPLQQTYIEYSNQDERRKTTLWISVAVAVLIMTILSFTAAYQARRANENAALAQESERIARDSAVQAIQSERIARDLQQIAEESENIAEAQRSAARAQIYQTRTGGLYTSTLLGIDSLQRNPTSEAEQILRKNINLLPVPSAHLEQNGAINSIEFSPIGNAFVTASADGSTCVWIFPSGQNKFCIPSTNSVEAVVFSPDGKVVVSANQSGEVFIINAENGTIENTLNYNTPVWDLSIHPNGDLLAIARDDEVITIFNLITRTFNYDLFTFGSVNTASFSPDGKWIASGTSRGITTLWSVVDDRIISGPIHQGEVFEVEFSPDSKFFVSGGSDSVANLTYTISGSTAFRIFNEDSVENVAFNSDGSWFVTVSDDSRIRVWDTRTGKEKIRMLQDSFMNEVQVSPNGQWIATTGYDNTLRIWSAATGAEIFQIPLGDVGTTLAFSQGGNFLISGSQSGDINIWDISSIASALTYVQFNTLTQDVEFSSAGDWIAASTEGQVWFLNYENPASLKVTAKTTPDVTVSGNIIDFIVSPDANWLALSADTGEVVLYNIASKAKQTITSTSLEKKILFSSDSSLLIIGNSDGKVESYNIASKEIANLYENDSRVTSLAGHDSQLAIGLLDKIILLDPFTGNVISEIESPGDHAHIAFNADGTILAASNSSGQIYIWKLRGSIYTLLNTLPLEQVFSMTFNPQGDQLLVGVLNYVYILDPNTGSELGRIRHKDIVSGLSFSADGSVLATASLKAIQFWNVERIEIIPTEELVSAACSRLTQNFDAAQWTSFFGEEEYRSLCKDLPVP